MKIQTVLFDLDGTILDSNELIQQSFAYTFKQFDYSFTEEELIAFNGPPLREGFAKVNPNLVDEMIQTYRDFNIDKHEEYIKLFPHVLETLEVLKDHDINMGIVTSKMRSSVNIGMEMTGLDRYFNTIVTIDDIVHSKPHPESVIKAMHALNAQTDSTLMVGDNYHDIVAGQNAGVKTAGVAWTSKGEKYLSSYKPTYMLQDMKDLLKIVGA